MRARLKPSFDRFIDAERMSDAEVAALLRELEIDIAVDLKGFTDGARPGILRAAAGAGAGQLSRLSPGRSARPTWTTSSPTASSSRRTARKHYAEKVVVSAGHASWPTTPAQDLADATPSRAGAGLARRRASCSAASTTATRSRPACSTSGCGCSARSTGSVLWLSAANAGAVANLRREAAARGVAPGAAGVRAAGAAERGSSGAAAAWPICFSTRCRTTPTPRRAMRCGPGCRC